MEHDLQTTIALLTRTPAAMDALLRELPEVWTRQNEGEGTMTVYDVVGHLIHAERTNWIPRAKTMIQYGDTQVFGAFDRWGHSQWIEGKPLRALLDEFARLRAENLAELRGWNLDGRALERRGRHPALGTLTLSGLLAAWAVHDLTHLHQISRVMAHQYRELVGPMGAFLGVLKCEGHSSPA